LFAARFKKQNIEQILYNTMEATDLSPLIEDLSENIDDLEEALGPILKSSLADVASKLPLLEKAKLQVLVVYAIESVLFCTYEHST